MKHNRVHHDHRRKCASRKLRFRNEADAREALALATDQAGARTIPVRVYYHVDCNGWHLTSQSEFDYPEIRVGEMARGATWRPPQTWADLVAACEARVNDGGS